MFLIAVLEIPKKSGNEIHDRYYQFSCTLLMLFLRPPVATLNLWMPSYLCEHAGKVKKYLCQMCSGKWPKYQR